MKSVALNALRTTRFDDAPVSGLVVTLCGTLLPLVSLVGKLLTQQVLATNNTFSIFTKLAMFSLIACVKQYLQHMVEILKTAQGGRL